MMETTYLGNDLLVAQTVWGGHVVVPTYNLDVAIGIVRDGIHEAWTTRLVQELLKEGDFYVNVGANFGYYTCLGGRIVGSSGKVMAIEANPHVFPITIKSVFYNGTPDRTRLFNRAAYNRSGDIVQFEFNPQFMGGGHLKEKLPQFDKRGEPLNKTYVNSISEAVWSGDNIHLSLSNRKELTYEDTVMVLCETTTATIDELIPKAEVDLLHLDIEGAEPWAIEGALEVISRSPNCKIIFEWEGKRHSIANIDAWETFSRVWDALLSLGYHVRKLFPMVAENGGITLSEPMSFDDMRSAMHGDYLAIKKPYDPWGE